ncbi:MAG: hypothetical protein RLZZ574_1438 [Cyanobacteriota bacterium]
MTTLLPNFDQATFESDTSIDNPYFPLNSGTIKAYEGRTEENKGDSLPLESNQIFATFDTKEILGVDAFVVRDVSWNEGVLVEDTIDWYAQDTAGNVWYLGENATNYEYDDAGNFLGTNNDGSWEAGVDGALPGFVMEANPHVGDNYYQEFLKGEAVDQAEVVSTNDSVSTDLGDYENVLKTRDFTQLEPDAFEFKYYAPGVGQVLADEGIIKEGAKPELSPELVGTSELPNITLPALSATSFENSADINNAYFPLTPGTLSVYDEEEIDSKTGEIEESTREVLVTNDTKDILGISSCVVQDRVFEDGLLDEETLSYYAQDTEGNVWLLGESKAEYEYNQKGNLISTDDSESWLTGEGQSLPGLIMEANPKIGDRYYQRFNIGQEEDQAKIVDAGTSISNEEYGNFEDVLQVQEFSALDPNDFDSQYYASGVGQVSTEELNKDGQLLFSSSLENTYQIAEIPDLGDRILGQAEIDATDVSYLDDNFAGSGTITELNYAQLLEVNNQSLAV